MTVKASIGSSYVDEHYWTARAAGEEWWPRFVDYLDLPADLVERAKAADEDLVKALERVREISAELEEIQGH